MLKTMIAIAALMGASSALAQSMGPPSPGALIEAQAQRMHVFDWMHGEWRGEAVTRGPEGEKMLVQTERVGPMLDGSILLVEGRGYDAETGSLDFNAFGAIHYDLLKNEYRLRSSAQGRSGDFLVVPVEGGFDWFIQQGPVKIRYEARNVEGRWVETGFVAMPGREDDVEFMRMVLERIGDSPWPGAGEVPMTP